MLQSLYLEGYVNRVRTELAKLSVDLDARNYSINSLDHETVLGKLFGAKTVKTSEIDTVPSSKYTVLAFARTPLQPVPDKYHGRKKLVSTGINGVTGEVITRHIKWAQFLVSLRFFTNQRQYTDKIAQWWFVDERDQGHFPVSVDMDGTPVNYSVAMFYEQNMFQEDDVQQEGVKGFIHMVGWDVMLVAPILSPLSTDYAPIEELVLNLYEDEDPWVDDEPDDAPVLEATLTRDLTE